MHNFLSRAPVGILLVLAAMFSNPALAAEPDPVSVIRNEVKKLLPDARDFSVRPFVVPGLYEVAVGPSIYYFSEDARYVIKGDVLDMRRGVNLTEQELRKARVKLIDSVDAEEMIVFAPEKPTRTINVFTDIDCGYCRKLHREIDQFNAKGIAVRYLAFPRSGFSSPGYTKAVSVWCAEDRKQAMTDAKSDRQVEYRDCDNPIKKQFQLGVEMGVKGTPAIVVDDGEMLPGYIPARELARKFEQQAAFRKMH